jgi:putative flippase GtrA
MKIKKFTKKQKKQETVRILEYMVTGGAWFWSGYIAFAVCYSVIDIGLLWSSIVANAIGLTINFLLERYWVFAGRGKKRDLTQVTIRYAIITAINFYINYLILDALKDVGITPYIGQFFSAGFFTVWNYLWYRFWVFTSPKRIRPKGKQRRQPPNHGLPHRKHYVHVK